MNKLMRSANVQEAGDPASHPATLHGNWNYEVTVQEIEHTISRIESGELELADVFDQFSNAVDQLRQCEAFLSQRQQQADLLIEMLNDDTEF
jgi:exodeoxyribonuclease VII small subunit